MEDPRFWIRSNGIFRKKHEPVQLGHSNFATRGGHGATARRVSRDCPRAIADGELKLCMPGALFKPDIINMFFFNFQVGHRLDSLSPFMFWGGRGFDLALTSESTLTTFTKQKVPHSMRLGERITMVLELRRLAVTFKPRRHRWGGREGDAISPCNFFFTNNSRKSGLSRRNFQYPHVNQF